MVVSLLVVVGPVLAAEEDAIAAIYAYGRTGTRFTMGFAVGDGSYVLTTADAAREMVGGKSSQVPYAVIVSRWTGDAYVAKVVASDEKSMLALFKLPTPAFPAIAVPDDKALSRVKRRTIGDVLAGTDAGERFPSEIIALTTAGKPPKLTIATWRASAACTAEVTGDDWLFLSQVAPLEKIPDAAAVVKRGVGALGLSYRRVVVTGGGQPVIYYKSVSAPTIRAFLSKAGLTTDSLATPSGPKTQASDGEASFRAMCSAISSSNSHSGQSDVCALAATKYRPKSALALMLYGVALARKGSYDEAIKSIDASLALDPSVPDGNLNRGAALAAAGKSDEAEKSLRKAATLDSTDARPLVALTDLLLDTGKRLDDALAAAKEAIKASPDDTTAKVAMARVKKHSKDYDGAIADLQSVIKAAPSWANAHNALGATYQAAGKPDLAEAEYRKVVELQPSAAGARLTLIDFLVTSGRNDDARKEIESARKLTLQAGEVAALKTMESKLGPDKK